MYQQRKKMSLKEWMDTKKVDIYDLANMVGCNYKSILNWRDGIHKPYKLLKRELMRVTNYEVDI